MSDSTANGATAPRATRTRAEIADDIRAALAEAEHELEQLQTQYDEHKRNVKSLRTALDAIDPDNAPKPQGRRPGRPSRAELEQREQRVKERNAVSPDTVELVHAELVAAGSAQSVAQMQKRLEGKISHDPVRRALVKLRDDERARVAGRTPAGGVMYAPMPELAEVAA